ncbi:MAG: zinc metalloprotease [Saprospiraceae bacterium]|nr:zinc metalloprotease [Saprospiraceae bacterium]
MSFRFILLLFSVLISISNHVYSQGKSPKKCGSDEHYFRSILADKNFEKRQQIIEKYTEEFVKRGGTKNIYSRTTNTVITIPVVIHVLWNISGEMLTLPQIQSQIDVLNDDFQLMNADTTNTPAPFKPLQANCQIEFCLAKVAPDGSPTTGIVYKHTNKTCFQQSNDEAMFSALDGDDIWDRESYLNIWTVPSLKDENCFDIAGYAQLPGGDALTDGIVIAYYEFGTTYDLGRTGTHEVGHWLNLRHIWGSDLPIVISCFDSDFVDDTPNQSDANVNCPDFPHHSCGSQPNGDMFMNYMDYTDDNCMNIFTIGQKDRMHALFQPGGDRYSILSSQACNGIADLIVLLPNNVPIYSNAGDNIVLEFIESNIGSESCGSNFVNFHLSEDDILTPGLNGDIYIDQYEVTGAIPPFSESGPLSKTIQIPSNINPGTYYIFFAADGTNAISEYDEYNNFATNVLIVAGTPPSPNQVAYRYWFSNNFNNLININVTSGNNNHNIQSNISTASLNGGLHSYNFQFKDSNNKWSSISSTFFYKSLSFFPLGNPRYQYWFDNSFSAGTTATIPSTNNLIVLNNFNTSGLSHGLHTFNIRFKPDGKHWSSINSSFFYKPRSFPIDMPRYEYWLDQNYASKTTVNNPSTNNFILLQNLVFDSLSDGLHTFNVRFKPNGIHWSSVNSSFFYKPKSIPIDTPRYEYWLDQNYAGKTTVNNPSTNNFILLQNIDFDTLSEGLHTFNIRFKPVGQTWSSISSSFFYKLKPELIGQAKYQYWYDGNVQDSITINTTSTNNFILLDSMDSMPLSEGLHTFNIRFKPTGELWSPVNTTFFVRGRTNIATEISKCLYWFDDDFNNNNTIFYSDSSNVFDIIYANTPGLDNGEHTLSMFFMDNAGMWSSIAKDTFVKDTTLPIQCPNNQEFVSGLG